MSGQARKRYNMLSVAFVVIIMMSNMCQAAPLSPVHDDLLARLQQTVQEILKQRQNQGQNPFCICPVPPCSCLTGNLIG